MRTTSKQITKTIVQIQRTIDKVAPLWSYVFDLKSKGKSTQAEQFILEHDLNIHKSNRCVIGEAHGFESSGEYNHCSDCGHLCGYSGFIFMNAIVGKTGYKDWRDHHIVKSFEKHWSEKHT